MKQKSIFDILRDISEDCDRLSEITKSIEDKNPTAAAYLHSAYTRLGLARIEIETYLEVLERGSE